MSSQPSQSNYCVVCTNRQSGTVRVVGPFADQDSAVGFATEMRSANRSWDYKPDVMDPPLREEE